MRMRATVVAAMVVLAAMAWVGAQDQPQEKQQKKSAAKLTMPWSKIESLTDEQKSQIREIRANANAAIKAIKEKETADIMALLNDEQKAQAQAMTEKQTSEKKSRSDKADAPVEKQD